MTYDWAGWGRMTELCWQAGITRIDSHQLDGAVAMYFRRGPKLVHRRFATGAALPQVALLAELDAIVHSRPSEER